jgi:hypothetical protein
LVSFSNDNDEQIINSNIDQSDRKSNL